jgi:hypothetical protein
MYRTTWLATALMAALLCALATASFAATPCEKRQLWDREFAYIDKISTTCRLLTTGAVIAAGLYAPYPSIVGELGGSGAATVARYASAFGVDLERVGFDKHHICRLVRAGRALHEQSHSGVRRRLMQYGLCGPSSEACKARVKAEIFKLYDLPATCPQP